MSFGISQLEDRNWVFKQNVTVEGDFIIEGDFTFGDVATDDLTINGFISTPAGKTTKFIETGTLQSTADGGLILSSTNARPNSFLCDDSGSNIGTSARNILARTLLTVDQSGGSIRSLMGQMKAISGVDFTTGVYTGVQGYWEFVANNDVQTGAKLSAVDASIEVANGATLTVDSGGILAGVKIELTTSGSATVTQTGDSAAVFVDTAGTITDWKVGVDLNDCTTGVDLGACTTGLNFSSTMTSGINFSGATLSAGTSGSVSNIALEIGSRTTEQTVTFAGGVGVENFEPVQLKVDFVGTNPASMSKVNMIYQQLTHDTTDMANLRLKCADFTIAVAKNLQDAYAYQGEIDFSGTSTIGGEAAVVGYTMNCGSGSVTGNVYGGVFAMQGTSTPAGSSSAIFLSARTSGMTMTNAVYIEPVTGATITNGIYINEAGTLTNFAKWAATGSSIVISDNAMTANNTSHAVRIAVGGATLYIPVFDTSNWG